MKLFRVKKYSKFPKQMATDRVIRTVDRLKIAQIISIELNATLPSRFYIEEVEVL